MKVFDVIINALFPNKCISCGSIIDRRESLCDYCYSKIERVDIFKVCKRCGLPKKQCVVIENAPLGICSGKAAGLTVYAVNTGILTRADLAKADEVFDSMADLLEFLKDKTS
jgi:phosphoglycolate phosphatase-like HAD superfamily hydrolase